MMAAFAACGLPGFANFAGEMTVLFGAWKAFRVITVLAAWGALIVGAVYMLRAVRALLHGPVLAKWAQVADAPHLWRKAPFGILLAALLVFGFFPSLLTDKIQPSAARILEALGTQTTPARARVPIAMRNSVLNPPLTEASPLE